MDRINGVVLLPCTNLVQLVRNNLAQDGQNWIVLGNLILKARQVLWLGDLFNQRSLSSEFSVDMQPQMQEEEQ